MGHVGSHSVTFHPTQVNSPHLTPARQAGARLTYHRGMEGRVDLHGLHGLHGLSAIPCNLLRWPLRNFRHSDSDTFTVLFSRVDSYKYPFYHTTISEWNNKLSQDVRSKPSVASFRSALLKVPGPVKINF